MEEHFGSLVDYDFTASLEEVLDQVARGEDQRLTALKRFYFGDKDSGGDFPGLAPQVAVYGEIDARAMASIPIEGSDAIIRVGRYGPYLQRGEDTRANIPTDLAPDELTAEKAEELFNAPSGEHELGIDQKLIASSWPRLVVMARTSLRCCPKVHLSQLSHVLHPYSQRWL